MEPEPYDIRDAFGGFRIFPDHVEPSNPQVYTQEVLARAWEVLNQQLWFIMYLDDWNGQ